MTNPGLPLPCDRRFATWAYVGGLALTLATACSPTPPPRSPLAMEPIGTVPLISHADEPDDGEAFTTPNSGTPSPFKESACAGGDFDALDQVLRHCETAMPRPSDLPDGIADKLQIRVRANAPSVERGGRLELTVTLRNMSKEPLPLYFSGAPLPRFDVETVDAKGKRADVPRGKPPPWPKGTDAKSAEVRASRVTLAPGASGSVTLPWRAVTYRWAPELAGSWEGRGFPRAASKPLSKGRYTLRFVVPILGVFEQGKLDTPILAVTVQ